MDLIEAAHYCNITRQGVYLAIRKGAVKARLIGKKLYVTKEDIDNYRVNKHNPDLRKKDGELIFDVDHGRFSVHQVWRMLCEELKKPYSVQRVYYLVRTGQLRALRSGSSWIISKEDYLELLKKEKNNFKMKENAI